MCERSDSLPMSLKRNIVANYVGQFYVTLIGIVMVPMYVKYMGVEAYGLVGFYAMLQSWFMLLDIGLTPAMSRETARFRGGASDASNLRQLLRALEGVFVVVAVLGTVAMIMGSGFIATSWLKVQELSRVEVQHSIMLMSLIAALRWVSGLYRGVVTGFEKIVWLNGVNIAVATTRFVLVIPFFIYVGTSPTAFFSYQLVIASIELMVLMMQTYRLLPAMATGQKTSWQWQPLRDVFKFSLSMALLTLTWLLVSQADKLVLSKLLPLTEYAYFTLAVLLASGVTIVSGAISGALLPRMTVLNAEDDEAGLILLYRNTTQLVAAISIPAVLLLAFFSEQVLWAWTGDANIARNVAPVLTLYALGNGIMALAAFPYYLQFAKGDLKLHMIGNVLFVIVFMPLLFSLAKRYGMTGAGYACVVANLLPFLFWLPIVHRRFAKGLHVRWLSDVSTVTVIPVLLAFMLKWSLVWTNTRLSVATELVFVYLCFFLISAASSSWIRNKVITLWQLRFGGLRT